MLQGLNRGFERGGQNRNIGHRALRGKSWSKRGPRSYYKGRGARSLGSINSKGRFRYNPDKLPVFVVPELDNFDNTPKMQVPPPRLPALDLSQAEVDLLDIVAPHHKKLRLQKKLETEKLAEEASVRESAADALASHENVLDSTQAENGSGQQQEGESENIEAEVVEGEKRARE